MDRSIVFTVFVVVFKFCCAVDPVVQLPEYQATGLQYVYQHNGSEFVTNAFYSLPYAQPPVEQLRFEKPLPLPVNPAKKINGQVLPPGCIQQENMANFGPEIPVLYPVSEDCLFVNVMAPSKPPAPGHKYPVLVWIHGGGFVFGMTRFYGMETLARHFNPRGVIVVGMQYRVGFLGFFSLDSSFANMGLYDQSAALKWIHTHISYFGGDPEQVTIWGNSAVYPLTPHTLSPLSNSYFRYAIQSSGSLYNLWTHSKHTRLISASLSGTLGCSVTNITSAKSCLKNKTIEQMWEAIAPFERMNERMDTVHWNPLMDEAFYAGKSLKQLTQESKTKNIMYGTTFGEGLVVTLATDNPITSVFAYQLGQTVDQQTSFTKTNFTNYISNYLNTEATSGDNRSKIQKIINNYYFQDESFSNNNPKFWYTKQNPNRRYHTSRHCGGNQRDKLKIEGLKQYMYLFDYIHPSHVPLTGLPQKYAPHAYEYQYLTDSQPYFPFNKSETNDVELEFTEKLVNCMTAFVKTGNPSIEGLYWPAIENGKRLTICKWVRL